MRARQRFTLQDPDTRRRLDATAQAQIERINEWHARRVEVLANRERWLADGLEMWHRAVLADDPTRKTISLPCGTLKSRVQQPVWEFDDEIFTCWAEDHAPSLLRVRSSIDKAAAKQEIVVLDDGRYITGTGEVVPGVSVTVLPPSFSVVTEQEVDG